MAALPVTTVGLGAVEMVFPDRDSLSADISAFFSMDLAMVRTREDLPPGSIWEVALHLPWSGATLSLTGRSSRRLREGWLLEVIRWRTGHRERLWTALESPSMGGVPPQLDEDATVFRSSRPGRADDLNPRARRPVAAGGGLRVAPLPPPAELPPSPDLDTSLDESSVHRFKSGPRTKLPGGRTPATHPPSAGSWQPPLDADETVFRSTPRQREAVPVLPLRQTRAAAGPRVRPPKRRAVIREKQFDESRHLDHSDWEGILTHLEGGTPAAVAPEWGGESLDNDFSASELELFHLATGDAEWANESATEVAPRPERPSPPPVAVPPVRPAERTSAPPVQPSPPSSTVSTTPPPEWTEPSLAEREQAPRSTTPAGRNYTSVTPPPVPKEFRRESPVTPPPRRPTVERAEISPRSTRSLGDRGVALVLLDHHLTGRSGWMEVNSAGLVRRLRIHQGDVIDFEQMPPPSLRLFQTAAGGIGLSWEGLERYAPIFARSQPEDTLVESQVLSRRQAAQLRSRRVSLQLARLLTEGWRGEVYFEESQARVTLLPEPRVPTVRLVWDTLRARCFEARPGAIRRQLRFVGRTGFVWDVRSQFPMEEAQLRPEEQDALTQIQHDPIGVAAQLVAGRGRGDLVTLATFWCLLMVGMIAPQQL